MAARLISNAPKALAGTLVLAIAATVYCQAHGGLEGDQAALEVSLLWGFSQGLGWGLAATAALALLRRAIRAPAAPVVALSAAAAVTGLAFAGGLAAAWLWALTGGGTAASLDRLLFDLAPAAGAAGAGTGLAAWLWPRPPTAVEEWLTLPEAPFLRVRANEVTVITAAGNYCELATANGPVLVRAPLAVLAERWAEAGFLRVHRGWLVNRARVSRMGRGRAGRCTVLMDDGTVVPVGDAWREALALRLGSSRP
ncbi:MAG: hypothetical protein K0R83_278 [Caulobacter sp.]|jgi:hypothetical protein|nr:hypothetical protein [Caulobacter sp.]